MLPESRSSAIGRDLLQGLKQVFDGLSFEFLLGGGVLDRKRRGGLLCPGCQNTAQQQYHRQGCLLTV